METINRNYTIKNDPRWQHWAYAITQGTTMARRKWTGKNRPFRQDEYEDGVRRLFEHGVLKKIETGSYWPRGGEGWSYICDMANGLKTLPPPPPQPSPAGLKLRHFNHARFNRAEIKNEEAEVVEDQFGGKLVKDESNSSDANIAPHD